MGIFPAKLPVTDKTITEGSSENLIFGHCEMQGWRMSMEDASICFLNYEKGSSLFGILDGHGGSKVSQFVKENFLNMLIQMRAYKNQNYEQALIETFLKFDELLRIEKIDSCLRQNDKLRIIFTDTIENLCEKEKKTLSQLIPGDEFPLDTIIDLTQREKMTPTDKVLTKVINSLPNSITSTTDDSPLRYRESSNCIRKNNEVQINIENNYSLSSNSSLLANEMGTTANILLIKNNYMYLANVGDSLAYMYKNGQAVILTQEHKSTVPSEHSRIIQSGAEIVHNRINGKLNLTRAIGDLSFKNNPRRKFYEQAVIAFPEINKVKITNDIEFIIMASDGVWDCVHPQPMCEYISKRIAAKDKLSSIIKDILGKIISKANNIPIGTDNMSCVIIQFDHTQKNI